MREAMNQVKQELGEDAIIVTTREVGGGKIRITAAIEQENRYGIDLPEFEFEASDDDDDTDQADDQPTSEDIQIQNIASNYAWRPPAIEDETDEEDDYLSQWLEDTEENLEVPMPAPSAQDEIVENVTDALIRHRCPSYVSEKIIAAVTLSDKDNMRDALAEAIETLYDFTPLPTGKHNKPIILVGPPGAGKTLNTAKLATRAVQNGIKPVVITTDIVRAGGLEMLSTFLDILDLPLYDVANPAELKSLIEEHKDADQILIDTGGLNPFDPHEMKDLAKLLRVADMESVLVLPGGGDAEESGEMALTFELLGVKRIYPTRLDFARRLGGVMAAADRGGLSFAGASHTHRIPDGVLDLTPKVLADLLMPGSYLKGKI